MIYTDIDELAEFRKAANSVKSVPESLNDKPKHEPYINSSNFIFDKSDKLL